MQFLNNMKVGSKIVLLLSVLLASLALMAGTAFIQLKTIENETDVMYRNNLIGLSRAKEANIQLINISRAVRNMALVAPEARPNYVAAYNSYVARAREELKEMGPLLLTREGLAVHEKTVQAFEALLPKLQEAIDGMDGMSREEIVTALLVSREYANTADDLMTELGDYMTGAARARSEEIGATADKSYIITACALFAALLIGSGLGLAIKRAIANPLVLVAGKATLVADGDLGQDFSMKRNDELGSLATALQQMVLNLRERIAEAEQKTLESEEQSARARQAMLEANEAKEKAEAGQQAILLAAEQVDQVVNRLSAATEELSAQIEQSTRGTEMQRDRVSQSATAMEEMNSTVMEVARNAGVAAEGSDKAMEKASQGAQIVEQSIHSINTVQGDTEELRVNMEELGRQAESIGTIMTVISDIADQTNLLALNAAIEAARAGEAGRGFAVVADEVRKLAEKTMDATKEVGSAIGGIQNGTKQSIAAVERTTGNLDGTIELVQRSGSALTEIVTEVSATASQVSGIATAAEEQSAASDEITRSLEEINRMAGENATAMQQSAQAVSELSQQAMELQALVHNLRADQL